MKGIIFNLLEDVVVDVHEPDLWDALLARSMLQIAPAEVLRWFGRQHECMHDGARACVFSLAPATAGALLSVDAAG